MMMLESSAGKLWTSTTSMTAATQHSLTSERNRLIQACGLCMLANDLRKRCKTYQDGYFRIILKVDEYTFVNFLAWTMGHPGSCCEKGLSYKGRRKHYIRKCVVEYNQSMKYSKSITDCLSHERVLLCQLDTPFARHAQVCFGWPELVHRVGMRCLAIVGNCACVHILVNEHKANRAITVPVDADSGNWGIWGLDKVAWWCLELCVACPSESEYANWLPPEIVPAECIKRN